MKLLCKHIWKMEKEEYNYSTFRLFAATFIRKYEHYIQYFKCVKCGKTNIKETSREMQLTEEEKGNISLRYTRPIENTLQKEADSWRNTATILSVKLRRAVEILKYYAETEDENSKSPARDALIDIEGE